jgi:hypothetical protein
MNRKCLFLMVSIVAGMLFLSTVAMAVPVPGTYSTMAGTLQVGFWQESFVGTHPGAGGSQLTAFSGAGYPPSPTGQWSIAATSNPTSKYSGGGPASWGIGPWDYVTQYLGTLTLGPNLTTGDSVAFAMNATNYNTGFGKYGNYLQWEFQGTGTFDGYQMTFDAKYLGSPQLAFDGTGYDPFWDLLSMKDFVTGIQMEMKITGPAPVPEPATMLLLGTGLMGLAAFGRKKLFKKA